MRNQPSPAQLELLRSVPGFRGHSDRDLAAMARLVDEQELEEGTVLVREGTAADRAYLIVEGWAAVTVHDEPVAALGPGQFVGEMALIDSGPRSATVVAKTPMRVLAIGPEAFKSFASRPEIARSIARDLSERLREQDGAQPSADPNPQGVT